MNCQRIIIVFSRDYKAVFQNRPFCKISRLKGYKLPYQTCDICKHSSIIKDIKHERGLSKRQVAFGYLNSKMVRMIRRRNQLWVFGVRFMMKKKDM